MVAKHSSFHKQLLKYLTAFLPAAAWAGLIFLFSSQEILPSLSLSTADFIFKKTAHIVVYAVLYFLIIRGLAQLNYKFNYIWFKAFLICIAYAVFDEIHQSTVPGRTAAVTDVAFDSLGAGLVILYKFNLI